jgi:YHS domain-containing protein
MMKKFILFLVVGIGIAVAVGVGVNRTDDKFKQINTTAEKIAVKGFDTVAYFAENSAVKGNSAYEFVWKDSKWLFSSMENLEKFKANPEQYAPQFGGYCSFAVSKGYTADSDPEAWKVVDGKLYLNYNQKVKQLWEAEQEQLIENGRKNWEEFKHKKPEHKG